MIEELRITDLGVINQATIALHPGLTVVTGETGAGKTMIVTGVDLLLGARADPKSVRSGAERARVEGSFRLPADRAGADEITDLVTESGGDIEEDDLLIARHVTAAGRSRAYLGGAQVPAGLCADVVSRLVTVHGQAEQVRLASPERQRELLDRACGPKLTRSLGGYQQAWSERRSVLADLDELRTSARQRMQEIDLLKFGLDEIAATDPQPGEDVALSAEAERLQAADDLRLSAAAALTALTGTEDGEDLGSALTTVAAARKAVEELADRDPGAGELSSRTAEIGYLLTDLSSDLSRYLDDLEVEPGRLEEIAARRSALAQLTRKYGASCDEVLAWSTKAAEKLTGLEGSDETIGELELRLAELDQTLETESATLTRLRSRAAGKLAKAVITELGALALPHARISFAITPADPGPYGRDAIELLFSANPGTEPRNLAKVASGGELSRVRLALEVVLADGGNGGTFVFDEVDAGVGGRVAVEIGRRLASLAEHAQVVVVTHLAQVAAFGDRHYVVDKADDGQVTTSGVREVTDAERSAELARMMAGLDTTTSSLAHADELVELAARHRGTLSRS